MSLAVLLCEERHLELECGRIGQILRLLLDVLVLHPLHVLLLFPPDQRSSNHTCKSAIFVIVPFRNIEEQKQNLTNLI
jgi:hypothetical protein